MDKSENVVQEKRMTGKLRTIGITLFGLTELFKYVGIDLGLNQDDIYNGVEVVSGTIAIIGAAISWGKLIYRKIFIKD